MTAGNFADAFAFRSASPCLIFAALVLLAGSRLPADETADAPPTAADREQGDDNWSDRLRRSRY
jgi:hypothetical protein